MPKANLWINTKVKKFKSWIARGGYNIKRGNRHFVLTNTKTGKTYVYESPAAAQKDGWTKQ